VRTALRRAETRDADKEVIACCRIGERSSHAWFVLKYLLGYPDDVRNYDGSWTEWRNLVRTPIEKWTPLGRPLPNGLRRPQGL